MDIFRFTLGGKHAFFKKPEVNSYYYFTYGNIHKVALLGMFGAILGYGGYTQMKGFEKKKKQDELTYSFPEFYERLKDVKLSIIPESQTGFIPKKIQTFNNSVGYASKEKGGNLIVKEQWLENPKWEIGLLIDSEEAEKIKDAISHNTCVYYPYLGKNDHLADIQVVGIESAEPIDFTRGRLSCFFQKDKAEIADLDYDELEELDAFSEFKYEEELPYEIDGWTNSYIMKAFVYTDAFVENNQLPVYQLRDGKKIMFY